MPDNTEANAATADALTLLRHNQHAIAAVIEELSLWAKANAAGATGENALNALQTLDANASAITAGTLKLRQ
ncbi:hypothetical protein [Pseudomonas lundensis]|uniref:hypothetical protein n=1 Tax=Pseudomonas lundensis TaxID=86185 RepID=UPI00065388E5|nr:hypothetical protein [Pseudomonas lundensis]KMM91305.1 hypothetical protein TU74_09200 [Pseudomonas lundensis]